MTTKPDPVQVILPSVAIEGVPLEGMVRGHLKCVTVETHLHLPGLFELTFAGVSDEDLRAAGIVMRAPVTIAVAAGNPENASTLIRGEITALEGMYQDYTGITVIRGYDLSHRLQRVRRTRAFLNTSDSEAAQQIATDAGLEVGEITPTEVIHEHLPQYDQTDWEFLKQRAAEIGHEFSMAGGAFCFRKASSIAGAQMPVSLTLHKNLHAFAPRVTAGNLTPDVEVRVWDPLAAKVFSGITPAATGAVSAAGGQEPAGIAGIFSDPADGAGAGTPPSPVVEELGPPPTPTSFVLYDRPVGGGVAGQTAADLAASGLAEHLASTFAEADGNATGNAGIQAGAVVRVSGIPTQFPESWVVTRARHVFDFGQGGYHTEFAATGRHDRSLLGLASLGRTQAPLPRIPGVVCAVVTNNSDQNGRVKVTLPWLSPDYESDWSPVVQFGAGPRSGAMFLPEVGDEVLVGFEFGDPRRAYVLGGIPTYESTYSLGGPPVSPDGTVVRRGFVAASGNLLVFHDEMPPGSEDREPAVSQILLGTQSGAMGLAIDIVEGTLGISCAPEKAPGQLTIKCADGGVVNIQTGAGGTMTIDGGDNLTIKSKLSMTIKCDGDLAISGQTVSLGAE